MSIRVAQDLVALRQLRLKSVKPNSTRILELRAKAKREGWLRWIRQGEGEQADELAMLAGCRFDQRRVDHWYSFADQFGTLTEGAYAGKKFRLLPWQAEDSGRFFGWVKDSKEWGYPVRRFKFFFEEVPKKNGKALCVETLIPTVNGFKKMKDVHKGDFVFSELGTPIEVVFESEIYESKTCYDVEFSNGQIVTCDGEHLWTLETEKGESVTITTEEMKAYLSPILRWNRKLKVETLDPFGATVKKLTQVENRLVKCIQVANPTSLFLCSESWIATHNTPYLSLIGNYLFFADCIDPNGKQRQIDIYTAATTRKQAERVLIHSIRQIKNSEELSKVAVTRKLEGFQSVQYGENNWYVVSSDPASADGVNGHCLADEFHRWKGFEFFNTLRWMLASQPEGVFAAITTAGEEGENVWKFTHDYCKAVNSGRTIDESFCGRIYAADKDDDPHDEQTWFKANPSLGTGPEHPLKLSTFRSDYEAAKSDPTAWPSFLRLRLGIPQSQTNTWIETAAPRGLSDWDSGQIERSRATTRIDCYEAFTDESLAEIDATTVTLALDLAAVRDTCAAVVAICDQNNTVRVRPYFWLPIEEARRQRKRVNYKQWAEAGHITLTNGDVIDYRRILNDLIAICDRFQVQRFYFDPLFQAEWLTQELAEATGIERIEFAQTIVNYAPLVKECERRIIAHDLLHNGNPVLTWQVSNAVSWENANGDKRIQKRKGGDYRKVDGVQAMIMSLRDSLTSDQGGTFYDHYDVEEV